jgi:hypothetical protein
LSVYLFRTECGLMSARSTIYCAVLMAVVTFAWGGQKPVRKPHVATETLSCRLGTENRHARIAVVLVGGRTDSFAYYSKWKPRTCSIYVQRKRDAFSTWRDKGNVTTVNIERGVFLIEHRKGEYRFIFRDIDRERYCGMDGRINGTLTIRRGNERCELTGIMEEGVPLGQAFAHSEQKEPVFVSATGPVATSAMQQSDTRRPALRTPPAATGLIGD